MDVTTELHLSFVISDNGSWGGRIIDVDVDWNLNVRLLSQPTNRAVFLIEAIGLPDLIQVGIIQQCQTSYEKLFLKGPGASIFLAPNMRIGCGIHGTAFRVGFKHPSKSSASKAQSRQSTFRTLPNTVIHEIGKICHRSFSISTRTPSAAIESPLVEQESHYSNTIPLPAGEVHLWWLEASEVHLHARQYFLIIRNPYVRWRSGLKNTIFPYPTLK